MKIRHKVSYLVNLNKSMIDGSVFNKLLDIKSPGEWIKVTQQIRDEHFDLKATVNYDNSLKKVEEFCRALEGQLERRNDQHRMFVENFTDILVYKYNGKMDHYAKKIHNTLADILYLLNRHPKQLLYFYPELSQDPMLRKHLQKMVNLK